MSMSQVGLVARNQGEDYGGAGRVENILFYPGEPIESTVKGQNAPNGEGRSMHRRGGRRDKVLQWQASGEATVGLTASASG